MEQPTYYGILPASVRYAKIEAAAKLLYSEITALANERGYCFASNEHFAKLYEVDPKTVSRWVKALSDAGFVVLDINQKRSTKRHIYVSIDAAIRDGVDVSGCVLIANLPCSSTQKSVEALRKNVRSSTQKSVEALRKNVQHNNKENNKRIIEEVEEEKSAQKVETVTAAAASDLIEKEFIDRSQIAADAKNVFAQIEAGSFEAVCLNDEIWVSVFAKNNQAKPDEVKAAVVEFEKHLQDTSKKHFNLTEYRRHFKNHFSSRRSVKAKEQQISKPKPFFL